MMRPCGDRAVLVELEGNRAAHTLSSLIRERFGDVVLDVVPGHSTVLITWAGEGLDPRVADAVRAFTFDPAAPAHTAGRRVTIDVTYDGPDLDEVARHTGLSVEEVVRRHRAAEYRVGFVGFAPGFGYLLGGDPALHVPRRATPRERVPGGSVALAGEYCAVYPSASPGGWQLIGRTDQTMFDPAAARRPAVLEPGDTVRFA
jgi:KipI family sensor histidine kinase inhibitor